MSGCLDRDRPGEGDDSDVGRVQRAVIVRRDARGLVVLVHEHVIWRSVGALVRECAVSRGSNT